MSFARVASGESLSLLGECKVKILNSSIYNFVNEFSKVTNVETDNSVDTSFELVIDEKELEELKELSVIASSLAKGAAGGVVSGAVTAFGAYSAAGILASASTGTAIATLSGAAATNATLAFFGGGSIAAGGLGIAGGTAVLGLGDIGPEAAMPVMEGKCCLFKKFLITIANDYKKILITSAETEFLI